MTETVKKASASKTAKTTSSAKDETGLSKILNTGTAASARRSEIAGRRRDYETIFIVTPGAEEKNVTEIIEKLSRIIQERSGTLLRKDDWGKLRMAYEIEKHAQGRYFYLRYLGSSEIVKELERNLKLDVNIIRYQTVRLSDDLTEVEQEELKERAPKEVPMSPTMSKADEFAEFA